MDLISIYQLEKYVVFLNIKDDVLDVFLNQDDRNIIHKETLYTRGYF